MKDDMIKAKVKIIRQFYPRGTKMESGDWGILSVEIINLMEGEPVINPKWDTITIKGICPEWNYGEEYTLIAKEEDKGDFEYPSYGIITLFKQVDLSSIENQKVFLRRVLTDNQVNELYKTIKNPMKILEEHNIEELCKVKGIGVSIANKIITKYEENKDYSTAYVELDKLGLSDKMVKKLCDAYENPNILLQKINEDPYIIADEVNGIGWSKADEIAMKSGIPRKAIKRIKAYIKYRLHKEANENGHVWIWTENLVDDIESLFSDDGLEFTDIMVALGQLKNEKRIWSDENNEKIALSRYYWLEKNIAKDVVREISGNNLKYNDDWEQIIKNVEKDQGWEYGQEQKEGIKKVLENNFILITGFGGCVDKDTEFFDGAKWKKISDFQWGDKVLQYNKDGSSNLVYPKHYIKAPCDKMWHFETKYGLDQCLTENHKVVYQTSKGNLYMKPFSEVMEAHKKTKTGFSGKFYTTFNYSGKGIDLSEFEIRLMCAVICDGSFSNTYANKNICRINIKKERKKKRLEWILNNLGIDYRKEQYNPKDLEYNSYLFEAPRREKEFTDYWYNCTNEQFRIICDEILYWDGSFKNGNRKTFSTTVKKTADFIQFAFATQRKRASIKTRNRVGQSYKTNNKIYIRKSIEYDLSITDRNMVSMGGFHNPKDKTKIVEYKPLDGFQYCFTVSSGMLVLRRNNKIFITGNCGKSSIVNGILKVLKEYDSAQCALSGKASVNLTQITGQEGFTIHRLLGYNPTMGWLYTKDNKMPYDIIIIDELSMVDEDLFYKIIQAVDDNKKVIMLGDVGQLQNLGVGNLIRDFIDSELITHVNLTEIHRQAKKSGIITDSIKIWHGEHIIDKGFVGHEFRGELKDFELIITKKHDNFMDDVIDKFKEIYTEKCDSIDDIMVELPMKKDVQEANRRIQKYIRELNVDSPNDEHITTDKYDLYVGDKVMNVQNNYKTTDENGENTPIMNGNMGIIKEINLESKTMIIDFEKIGRVFIPTKHLKYIELGYSATVNKLQGSTIKYIVCALNNTHYKMRTKEILYTMITRASKHCALIGESSAIRYAVKHSGSKMRNTFLADFIKQEYNKIS